MHFSDLLILLENIKEFVRIDNDILNRYSLKTMEKIGDLGVFAYQWKEQFEQAKADYENYKQGKLYLKKTNRYWIKDKEKFTDEPIDDIFDLATVMLISTINYTFKKYYSYLMYLKLYLDNHNN